MSSDTVGGSKSPVSGAHVVNLAFTTRQGGDLGLNVNYLPLPKEYQDTVEKSDGATNLNDVSQLKHNIDNIDKGLSGPYVLAGGGWACVFAVIVFVAVGGGTMGIGLGVGLVVAGIVAGGVGGKNFEEWIKDKNTAVLQEAFGREMVSSAEVLTQEGYPDTSKWLYEQCFEKFHLGGVRRPTLTGQQGSMIETGILVSSFEKKVTRMGDCYLKFTVNKREMYCKIPKKDDQEITQDDVTKAMLKTMAQEVINNKSKDSWVSSFGIWKLCGAKNQEA